MNIEWTRVTWYSQIVAIVLFVAIFGLGICLGMYIESKKVAKDSSHIPVTVSEGITPPITYACDGGKEIRATYTPKQVFIQTTDGRSITLPQTISADGGRYSNADQSFVFWSKGSGAFITEASTTTFSNCKQIPAPVSE